MRKWINNRFHTNFTEEDLSSVKDFSLIWNVFENVVCQNNFSISQVKQEIVNNKIDAGNFLVFLQYFQQRYVLDGAFTYRFNHLHFRPNDRKNTVEQVLLGDNTNNDDIVLALVIIVYRYRNNLFHGLKDMQEIDQQKNNFDNANGILKSFLDNF